ncbi:hypothetical protein DL96DRAFT_862172 [Flagelloscypha sp. PMI_526]|nr:hypothetical protein DL96DRAFT_862172 [Flagelloscypha sp. PMI_526]
MQTDGIGTEEDDGVNDDYTTAIACALYGRKHVFTLYCLHLLPPPKTCVVTSLYPNHQLALVLRSGQSGTRHDTLWTVVSTLVEPRTEAGLVKHALILAMMENGGQVDIFWDEDADYNATKRNEMTRKGRSLRRNFLTVNGLDPFPSNILPAVTSHDDKPRSFT